jgi:hypothetical protein
LRLCCIVIFEVFCSKKSEFSAASFYFSLPTQNSGEPQILTDWPRREETKIDPPDEGWGEMSS